MVAPVAERGWFRTDTLYIMQHNCVPYTSSGTITEQLIRDYLGIPLTEEFRYAILGFDGDREFEINVVGIEENTKVSVQDWNAWVEKNKN